MTIATCIHYSPPLNESEAKNLSYIKKFVKKEDIHVVSFIFAYDDFWQYVDKKVNIEKENEKVEDFIKKNDFLDTFDDFLFNVEKNPRFKHYVIGFSDIKKIDNLLKLIKKGLVEDVRFWKNKAVVLLVNAHESQVFDLL